MELWEGEMEEEALDEDELDNDEADEGEMLLRVRKDSVRICWARLMSIGGGLVGRCFKRVVIL